MVGWMNSGLRQGWGDRSNNPAVQNDLVSGAGTCNFDNGPFLVRNLIFLWEVTCMLYKSMVTQKTNTIDFTKWLIFCWMPYQKSDMMLDSFKQLIEQRQQQLDNNHHWRQVPILHHPCCHLPYIRHPPQWLKHCHKTLLNSNSPRDTMLLLEYCSPDKSSWVAIHKLLHLLQIKTTPSTQCVQHNDFPPPIRTGLMQLLAVMIFIITNPTKVTHQQYVLFSTEKAPYSAK